MIVHNHFGISPWGTTATLVALLFSAMVLFAAESGTMDDPQELKKIIEAQQRQLDAQQQELEAQRQVLQELLQKVQKLTKGEPATAQSAPESVQDKTPPEPPSADRQKAESSWPGSISLFGSKTRLAVGGFAQFDFIYDTNAIDSRCQFITSTIPTDGGTRAEGADGQSSFCVNTSRLTFETRTPTRLGRLKTMVSLDLFGNPLSNKPSPRLYEAYGELSGALWGGDLLFGQSWGTFVGLEAWPDILDFEGPGSAVALRQPIVRWTRGVSSDIDFRVAVEQPGGGSVEGADLLTRWPDFVSDVKWKQGGGHIRASGIVRDIRISANDNPPETAVGWGLAGSGKVMLPAKNNLVFEASYGKGIGTYFDDGPPSGIYDSETSTFELLPLFGYYAGFEHGWSRSLSSSFLFGALEVDNFDSEPGNAFRRSGYFSLNLIWRPDTPLMFGAEFLRGGRQDKDGSKGTDNRIQLTSQFSF